ncbi:SDR family NAD(P)-dependent oxidoreductase [Cedecea davisae]|uniref:SDR family NAD(P)-dependent oxidoreductase n=1 Tax=Cedecea davisae TaxID=158484 RepID=A0ABS6DCW0_9ENTR|nr:SDR family NAD(P)-dependent oxidoreductase [Cedecea davisae]MBU4680686.1 SDR family NAD(P)-dependent oxidoreductase [Cedecea davisae]MBU4685650.1 SDR family NAD(P)-dependent oxidoreductase [Cedecea davisae]
MKIKTQFSFNSTAEDVIRGQDLSAKRAVVTGAASGIGLETARALASAGAEVTLAVRNLEAGLQAADDIIRSTGNKHIHVAYLDLTDRDSIASFVSSWSGALHILINNAGVMAMPETRTKEDWEAQFATNYLGHYALTVGLHGALKQARGARVVAVSSSAHHFSPIVFDDIHYHIRPYDPWTAYAQSKTAQVLFAVEASRRWKEDGIFVNAVMPGAIKSNLQRHSGELPVPEHLWKSAQQGAATSVMVATLPELEDIGGRYFADCNEAELITRTSGDRMAEFSVVAGWALDSANAARLWTLTEDLLN